MIHIRNLSVRSKIAIAYLILLILLIGTGLIALFGVNKINRTVIQLVDKLAEEQQVTNKIIALEWENQYFANEYIENNLRLDLAKYTNSMLSLKDILNNYQKLTDDSERIIMIDEIRELQLDYASNFSNINNLNNTKIILNNEVLTIQDTLITSKLARLGENTIFTNNSDKLTLLNSAQYHISLIKSYILQYSTNSDDHWAYSTFDELIILISIFNKMIDLEKNPKQLELAIDTRNTIYLYRDGLFEYKEITDTINNLVNKNINILGPKMRSIANEISSQTKEDFNKAETQTQQNVEKIQIIIIILLVISLMSFYLIVKFLSYSITSPLRELTRVAEKIKSGDLSVRANIHTKNELGLLADTFNSMTITLQDNIDHLENRVSSRTNELIKVNEVLNNQINELNRAENRINELQISLSNIIDSMPSILVSVDKNGYITQWNKTAENITTVSSIEAKGKLISSLLPEMEEQMYKVFESINTGNIINETVEILNTDKSLSYNNIIIYPLIAEVIEGAVIQIYNVTENYKLQDQLAHNNRMDAIGQLAGGIAHDFNNVLGGILNASQLLVMPQRNLDKKSLVCVDLIKKAAVRASDLTSKLLTFGKKNIRTNLPFIIDEALKESLAILNSSIDKRIKLILDINVKDQMISGDRSGIENAIINLGINASQAMVDGGLLHIIVERIFLDKDYCNSSGFRVTPGNYVFIQLKDTGCGIPKENIKRIFEPFFTTKLTENGSGLGLAAVYGTVEDHNGVINVESEESVGTTFNIMLPAIDNMQNINSNLDEIIKGQGTILFVDDEEIHRQTGKSILESLGYDVITANNGQDAVEIYKAKSLNIDLCIVDMIMPKMNGRQAFYNFKKINNDCKIIISSGYTDNENIDKLIDSGLSGFIKKPYNISDFSQLIDKVLR